MKLPIEIHVLSGTADTVYTLIIVLIIFAILLSSCARTGEDLFVSKGCIRCHSFKGEGGNIGPDLTAVTRRRSDGWINQQIRNSRTHNPHSRMPDYSGLSDYEIHSIIAYLKSG